MRRIKESKQRDAMEGGVVCLEGMGWVHLGDVALGGWEVTAGVLVLVGSVSVPVVGTGYRIRQAHRAIA